ncbi:MAG: N-acetylneuraminate synthase [Deltaproteobacteria bacterium]|nr:N-acetylneuraminate synthase [Deltaproteobacteria bacterium]
MRAPRAYIIAEAGVNHNGSMEMAKRLIDAAAGAGADAVKFQTFRAEALVSASADKARYQIEATGNGETQFEMLKRLELDEAAHAEIIAHSKMRGIQFLSTPFDLKSVAMLTERFALPVLKIPSGEITNAPLLLEAARTGTRIILSTGMSTLTEIETGLGVLAFGYTRQGNAPSIDGFREAYEGEAGKKALGGKVTLLHCTTEYPAPFEDVNLRAMETMRSAFRLPVGLSDHTEGIAVAIAAAALGACVIEKHVTLDRGLPGPDHRASLEPDGLEEMVRSIRQIESALGTGEKAPAPSEAQNMGVARKSLVAGRDIKKGEVFTEENLAVKRPGTGLSPLFYWEMLGKTAPRAFRKDEPVESGAPLKSSDVGAERPR